MGLINTYEETDPKVEAYTPEVRSVTGDELVEERMTGLLSKGNPYLEGFKTRSDQTANARGMRNSAIAVSAGEAAAASAALPIAQQDAQTANNQQLQNQSFTNTAKADQFAAQQNIDSQTHQANLNEWSSSGAHDRQQANMLLEEDIMTRMANNDQGNALQLEELKQKYNLENRMNEQSGLMYQDSIKSIAALLGNEDLTPEQQAAGQLDIIGQLEAGLTFVNGLSDEMVYRREDDDAEGDGSAGEVKDSKDSEGAADVPNTVSGSTATNNSTNGVYSGFEVAPTTDTPVIKYGRSGDVTSDMKTVRVDQSSGVPTLISAHEDKAWYRAENWSEEEGGDNLSVVTINGNQYVKMVLSDWDKNDRDAFMQPYSDSEIWNAGTQEASEDLRGKTKYVPPIAEFYVKVTLD